MAGNFYHKCLALLLVLAMGLCMPPCLAQEVVPLKEVKIAIKAKHYAEAVKTLTPLARDGNPRAAWMLGDLYTKGDGVPRDYNRARDLWEQATEAGDRDAMFSLAGLLSGGLGGPFDRDRAAALAQKSASLGCSKAQYSTGVASVWGWRSIKQDYSKALNYLHSAAKSGNGNAECFLGFMYENGFGVAKDPQIATSLMKSAKLHGCADGECEIGRTYSQGQGGKAQNYYIAFLWLNKAAEDGNERAMDDLGWMYKLGHGVKANKKKAVQLFLKAERNGNPFAKYSLAEMYRTGEGIPKGLKKAKALYAESAAFPDRRSLEKLKTLGFESMWRDADKQAYVHAAKYFQSRAKAGDGTAECRLAFLYENGFGVTKDPQRAAVLMKSARGHGCADEEFEIGKNYLEGEGVPKDYGKAFAWLSNASADGNPHAMNYLGNMYAEGKGVKADVKKAAELYINGAKGGCPGAKYNLAEDYRTGVGLPKDLQKARVLYEELAKSGDERAAEKLKRITSQ